LGCVQVVLVTKPCTTSEEIQTYKAFLQNLVIYHTGTPAKELEITPNPPWLDPDKIPLETQEKATELGVKITLEQWKNLTPLQRFALIKLSRPSHENRNFLPALKEFKLLSV
jgi:hypothetical protein